MFTQAVYISLPGPDRSSALSLPLSSKQEQSLATTELRQIRQSVLIQELEGLDLSTLDVREPSGAEASSDVRNPCSDDFGKGPISGREHFLQDLKECLGRLGSLHALQFRTSVTINWKYWRLGECYARFCKVCRFQWKNPPWTRLNLKRLLAGECSSRTRVDRQRRANAHVQDNDPRVVDGRSS